MRLLSSKVPTVRGRSIIQSSSIVAVVRFGSSALNSRSPFRLVANYYVVDGGSGSGGNTAVEQGGITLQAVSRRHGREDKWTVEEPVGQSPFNHGDTYISRHDIRYRQQRLVTAAFGILVGECKGDITCVFNNTFRSLALCTSINRNISSGAHGFCTCASSRLGFMIMTWARGFITHPYAGGMQHIRKAFLNCHWCAVFSQPYHDGVTLPWVSGAGYCFFLLYIGAWPISRVTTVASMQAICGLWHGCSIEQIVNPHSHCYHVQDQCYTL